MADLRTRFIEDYAGGLLNVARQELSSTGEVLTQDGFVQGVTLFVEDGRGVKSGLRLGDSVAECVDPTTETGIVNVRSADRTYAKIRDLKAFATAVASAQGALTESVTESFTNLEGAFESLENDVQSYRTQLNERIDSNNLDVSNLTTKITSIDSKLGSTNNSVTALSDKILEVEAYIVDVENTGIGAGNKGDIVVNQTGTGLEWKINEGVVGPDQLMDTDVLAGTYTNADITVDAQGRITGAVSGSTDMIFTQTGSTVERTVQDKLKEVVSVLDFIPPGTNTATTDCTDWIQAALDAFPTVETTTEGTVYKRGELYFPTGSYKIAKQLTLYPGVSLSGPKISTRYYVDGATNQDFDLGATILLDNPNVEDAIIYTSGRLENTSTVISNLIFTHTVRPSSNISANAISIRGGTKIKFQSCSFWRLRYTTAIQLGVPGGKNCNGIVVDGCNFGQQGQSVASDTSDGNCIDGTYCFDSKFYNNFAESCGGYFFIGSGYNSHFSENFVDLCKGGIYINQPLSTKGTNIRIVNNNFKWHRDDGIWINGVSGILIVGNTIMGNNYKSATTKETIGWGIKLDGKCNDIIITGNNLNDDYATTNHVKKKSVRQGTIKFGSNTTAVVSSNSFSAIDTGGSNGYPNDPDAIEGNSAIGWNQELRDNNGIWDENNGILAGRISIVYNRKSDFTDSSNIIHYPQPLVNPSTTSTASTIVKRFALRDVTGTVVGSVPLYDSVASNLLSVSFGDQSVVFSTGTSGSINVSQDSNNLKYFKIGPMVTITGSLLVESVDLPSGTVEIGPLPFSALNATDVAGVSPASIRVTGSNGVPSGSYWSARVTETGGNNLIKLNVHNGDTKNDVVAGYFQANTVVQISLTYFTSDVPIIP